MRNLLFCAGLFAITPHLSSCATVREAGEVCESESGHQIARVFREYERYRDEGLDAGIVHRSRHALESARHILFAAGGLSDSGPVCPPRQQRKPSWRELRDDFETAEILVQELEEVRGVRFLEIRAASAVWLDATTGEEVSPELAAQI